MYIEEDCPCHRISYKCNSIGDWQTGLRRPGRRIDGTGSGIIYGLAATTLCLVVLQILYKVTCYRPRHMYKALTSFKRWHTSVVCWWWRWNQCSVTVYHLLSRCNKKLPMLNVCHSHRQHLPVLHPLNSRQFMDVLVQNRLLLHWNVVSQQYLQSLLLWILQV